MKRTCTAILVAALATASGASALAAPIYHVTDLGLGYTAGINSKGQVAGTLASNGTNSIFLWSNGIRTNIGQWAGLSTRALDIGESGQIIGQAPGVSLIYSNGVMMSCFMRNGTMPRSLKGRFCRLPRAGGFV